MSITEQRLQELTKIAPTVSVKMDMEWLSSTTNTADFQIRLTNTGTSVIKLNALIIRGVHSPKITTGTTTWNPNSNFGFVWEMTSGGVIGYINFETQSTTSPLAVGFMHYGPTTNTNIGKCLTVTSPNEQILNNSPKI